MSTGIGVSLIMFYIIFMLGGIAAVVFTLIAFWRAMKAHESIAGSMKEMAEALQNQARTAALEAKKDI